MARQAAGRSLSENRRARTVNRGGAFGMLRPPRSLAGAMACAAAAVLAVTATSARADMPPIPEEETVLFADDFADNGNEWPHIIAAADEPAQGKACIGDDPLEGSEADVWYPAAAGTGRVESTLESIEHTLEDGPLAVYVRMRTEGLRRTDGSRVEAILRQIGSDHQPPARLIMRPGGQVRILTKRPDGKIDTIRGGRNVIFDRPDRFRSYRMVLTRTGEDRMTAEAFVYDEEAEQYVLLTVAVDQLMISDEPITQLRLMTRNSRESDRSFVDAVAVTAVQQ